MPVTVLIAEDDPEMRRVLKKVAEESGDVQVVGEAADGAEALALFETLRPRVVFIDIDLPVKDGATLARDIFHRDPSTYFVFITAYDQYREDAFEVYACDYLVKPFKIERLRQTLERLRLHLNGRVVEQHVPALSRLSEVPPEDLRLFRTGSRLVMLHLKDIIFITREGRRTVIYHVDGWLETSENLNTLAEEMGGYPFLHTQKGFIVNLKMVQEIIPAGRTYELIMAHTEKRALITSEKFRELRELLETKKRVKRE
ncbi:MAG: LytTR family DNA-binding domain-containing protein [Bacillota bacterium]